MRSDASMEITVANTTAGKVPALILTTFPGDEDELGQWYDSLIQSLPGCTYGLVAVDGGSEKCREMLGSVCEVLGPYPDLTVALNKGIEHCLGTFYEEGGIWQFTRSDIDPIVWVHPDMRFPEPNWIGKLLEYLEKNPDVAKVSPVLQEVGGVERPGNQCPWVLRTSAVRDLLNRDRMVFDPVYTGCGGYEDWDLNRRLMSLGYRVMISDCTTVSHRSMGTRSKHNTDVAARTNSGYYNRKWGDSKCPV